MGVYCPHCKEKITHLRNFQKTEVCYEIRLTDDGLDVKYEKQDDYTGCADDWGCAECPNCGEQIEEITNEEKAILFLQGKLKVAEQEVKP